MKSYRARRKRDLKKQRAKTRAQQRAAEIMAQLESKIRPLEDALNDVRRRKYADFVSGFTSQITN